MTRMTLNKREIDVVVDTMLYLDAVAADFGQVAFSEVDETEEDCWEEEFDGQPSEHDEWQDYYGGDDSIYEWDCDCVGDC